VVVDVVVFMVLVGGVVGPVLVRRRRSRQRRRHEPVYVPTYPTIEIEQPYGGWDADPSDAYTEHGQPRVPFLPLVGPPSRWGRLP
jgi:hypothetical protein